MESIPVYLIYSNYFKQAFQRVSIALGVPAFICARNNGVFLQDAFYLVSNHLRVTSLLLPQVVNDPAQLVMFMQIVWYSLRNLKCSSKGTRRDYLNENI